LQKAPASNGRRFFVIGHKDKPMKVYPWTILATSALFLTAPSIQAQTAVLNSPQDDSRFTYWHYDYADLMVARQQGLSDDKIAAIAKISDQAVVPFALIAAKVERGETLSDIAAHYGLKLANVLDTKSYKEQITLYKAVYGANPLPTLQTQTALSSPTPPVSSVGANPTQTGAVQNPVQAQNGNANQTLGAMPPSAPGIAATPNQSAPLVASSTPSNRATGVLGTNTNTSPSTPSVSSTATPGATKGMGTGTSSAGGSR